MFSILRRLLLALKKHSLTRYFLNSRQWLVNSKGVDITACEAMKSRVLISRSLCIYYLFDLHKVPKQRRSKALLHQVRISSPFNDFDYHVEWKNVHAQVWVWDRAALQKRLPSEALACPVVPDSVLAGPFNEGQRVLQGIEGLDIQLWQDGYIKDSRFSSGDYSKSTLINLSGSVYKQRVEPEWVVNFCGVLFAFFLLAGLLFQGGRAIELIQKTEEKSALLNQVDETTLLQQQAKRKAFEMKSRWLARNQLFSRSQSELVTVLAKEMPDSVSLWQRYDYRAGRLELLVTDPAPDPRSYVSKLNAIPGIYNVQVQLDPNNQRLRLNAAIRQE